MRIREREARVGLRAFCWRDFHQWFNLKPGAGLKLEWVKADAWIRHSSLPTSSGQ